MWEGGRGEKVNFGVVMPDAHRESDAECDMSEDLRLENLCDVGGREGGEGTKVVL
jgi:hypothetical protein